MRRYDALIRRVRKRRWYEERFTVFHIVILQRTRHVIKYCEIRRQIDRQIDAWEAREHVILVEDMGHTYAQYLSTIRGGDSLEHRAYIYHSLVLRGKLRLAVRWITDREKGGVFQKGYIFPKTGQPVLEVLCLKNPDYRPLTTKSLEAYGGKPPAMVPVDITNKTVATFARRLSGATGPGGDDSVSLQHWLLWFGDSSMGLQQIVGEFGNCMTNVRPLWAT